MTTKNYLDGAFDDNTYTIKLNNRPYRNDVVTDPNVRTMPRREGLSTNKQRKQRAKAKRARKIH
jgi:hypothetical protein